MLFTCIEGAVWLICFTATTPMGEKVRRSSKDVKLVSKGSLLGKRLFLFLVSKDSFLTFIIDFLSALPTVLMMKISQIWEMILKSAFTAASYSVNLWEANWSTVESITELFLDQSSLKCVYWFLCQELVSFKIFISSHVFVIVYKLVEGVLLLRFLRQLLKTEQYFLK